MNLYQAGYTRRGRQGEGAGWSIVSPSEDMSQDAKEGFSGFAGNLAELVNGSVMPKEAFGLFRHNRFLYYMNINYEVSGGEASDARGVSFTHGYCFNLADDYALCERPEQLLGVKGKAFLKEYDPSVRALPVVHELEYEPMDYRSLMDKYGLSAEDYRHLLIGATCALEGFADALCIKADVPLEEYGQICREIMYLIMYGLPYHLRTKVTFFSYKGGKTNVYFSDKVEGNNYFDLDTKEHACDKSKLERYRFTLVYNLEDDRLRQRLLRAMADFINDAFDIHLKDINCDQVEHAFHSQLKNVLGEVIDKDLTVSLLTSFMGFQLKDGEAVEEYLAVLLESFSENNLTVRDTKILNRVVSRAQNSANMALHAAYLTFYARQILALERQKGFNLLWEQYREDRGQYAILIGAVERMDESYCEDYYENFFLPKRLKSLEEIRSYLEESGKVVLSKKFHSLVQDVTNKEMHAAQGFEEQRRVRAQVGRVADLLDRVDRKYSEQYRLFVDYILWENFEVSQFSEEYIQEYRDCSLDTLAKDGFKGNACENAQTVKQLISVATDFRPDGEQIYHIFFTDEVFDDKALKRVLQNMLKKNQLRECRLDNGDEFDLSLMCYYSFDRGKMDMVRWIQKVFGMGRGRIFSPEILPRLVDESRILGDARLRKNAIQSLESALDSKAWKTGDENEKGMKRAMERCYACLNGEALESSQAVEAQGNFRFCLHKIGVGYLAVLAIAFFVLCMKRYMGMSLAVTIVVAAVAALGAVAAVAVRIYLEGGISEYLGNLGIEEPRELIIAAGTGLGLVLLAAVAWLLLSMLPGLQAGDGKLKTILGAVCLGVFTLVSAAAVGLLFVGEGEE